MWGFLLCFASTCSGTIMHYGLDWPAPYPWWTPPKLLGVPGGLLLVVGTVGLGWLKTRADRELGAPRAWGGEMGFVALLGLTGLSGLVLYWATGTAAVGALLAIHLGAVLALFLLTPYSKMAHGAYRFAALVRDAQVKSGGAAVGQAQRKR
jgi:citrate/tricarballylate utilization protein